MKLNEDGMKNRAEWKAAGYALPEFDRETIKKETAKHPFWIHFGAGNLFRASVANVVQKLLNQGIIDRGVIAAEGYDCEVIEKLYRPHDNYMIHVTVLPDGRMEKTVIGSITESLALDAENEADFDRLKEIFRKESLQIVTVTITEKGYSFVNGKGELLREVEEDIKNGPGKPASLIGKITALLYERFLNGAKPIAMVSMDNFPKNGEEFRTAVATIAERWTKDQKAEGDFFCYVNDESRVSFPWTMIDKIAPRPGNFVMEVLKKDDVEEPESVMTAKNTRAALFVNTEAFEYLIIEDNFPNGRPALAQGDLVFASRETVERAEKMKACTCFDPLQTALAIFGCLLGYKKISEEMKDEAIRKLVEEIGYKEGLLAAANPGIIEPKEFLSNALSVRLPNSFLPDTPQRIATDTSKKLAIRFGETIRWYMTSERFNVKDLRGIPMVFAGWLRYLTGVDDRGNVFALSPDELLSSICPYVMKVKLGGDVDTESLRPLLSDARIFGVDLYEAHLAEKVCEYFVEMCKGKGAVREVLERYYL